MRAWQIEEYIRGFKPKEYPWQEIWYIPTANSQAVLDIIKYTKFYDERTIGRFKEFRKIANELDDLYGIRVYQSGMGGVSLRLVKIPEKDVWDSIFDIMYTFNQKYFTTDEPKVSMSKRLKKNNRLYFGYC